MKVISLLTNEGFLKTHKLRDNLIITDEQVRKNLIKIIMRRRHSVAMTIEKQRTKG
jgi:hypothetical protein